MSVLIAEHLHKAFGEKKLFDDVSLTIERKDRIGLIGVNGTGKSSLLRVLAEEEAPDTGAVNHANTFSVVFVKQEPVFAENTTVLSYVFDGEAEMLLAVKHYEASLLALASQPESETAQAKLFQTQQTMDRLGAWDAQSKAKTILTKLGIFDFAANVQELSGGQQKRVALARALIQPVDLLLLDEPTNHLDHETVEWLEHYLASYEGALLMVTHDRYFLNNVVNTMYELDDGKLYQHKGTYASYLQAKEERLNEENLQHAKHQNLLRREMAWLQRGAKARTTKQKARKDRVEALKNKKGPANRTTLDISLHSERLGNDVIALDDAAFAYPNHKVLSHCNVTLEPFERVGIVGENGSGKTTLLQLMAGELTPSEGEVKRGETVRLGIYRQTHEDLNGDLRVVDYIKERAEVIQNADGEQVTAEQMLEAFLFPRSAQQTFIRRLSGGEKKRLYLLRVLMEAPNVIFLDEPTNDLDTETLGVLEQYLDSFKGTVVTVSHDRYFLDRVVDRVIWVEGNGQTTAIQGGYSEWLDAKTLQHQEAAAEKEARKAEAAPKTTKKKKMSYQEQKEWDRIEEDIADAEGEVERLTLAVAEAGHDAEKTQSLFSEQQDAEEKLQQLYDRWEALAALAE
ncbi:ABC-F family ATP-binding cassette domain-containing protein [Aureibacillus halotolerans]|uniref:ATP-binding cassette subfamily F protein uup n=1 Tax=Aureibacillus halotolerans TaxID=1508390 RepID=A0A4R6TV69_9BACI|nr:ABC-F family ATP-binding cassette domain-containing protein [Aureibacillus halotolerans]TDQ36552.1 ATP-binding cassette subfamily F protein uup [Aureibacillus halotolerans]